MRRQPAKVTDVVIAYEPIWAIGTGMTATATDANRTIAAHPCCDPRAVR